ncbi:MAG: VanZ family protein [Terriglobales bacterium]
MNANSLTAYGKYRESYARTVTACCLCVLIIILTAGLWPFHVPKNDVEWLKNENGLRFGRHASIVSLGSFNADSVNDDGATLEVWLNPGSTKGKATILAFDGAAHAGEPFTLYQDAHSLGIRRYNIDPQGTVRTSVFEVANIFQNAKRVFIAVILNENVTSVYVDGVLATVSERLGDSPNNLTGRLVVGSSPRSDDSWSGEILGLATYSEPLTPVQVEHHYQNWAAGQLLVNEKHGAVALYRFNEHGGDEVHNEVNSATNLTIPPHYFVLHLPLLDSAWRRQSHGWSYWQDVGINIAGFIPVGFFFLAYCSIVRPIKRPIVAVLLFGFALSLAIEVLQSFLPTRDSDMTDVITNTLGTVVGLVLYRTSWVQGIWQRFAMFFLRPHKRDQTSTDTGPFNSCNKPHCDVGQE